MSETKEAKFKEAFLQYQESCAEVTDARREFLEISQEAKAKLARVPLAPAGRGIESWDPTEAMEASRILKKWGESHTRLGQALVRQADSLQRTAGEATALVEEARGEVANV